MSIVNIEYTPIVPKNATFPSFTASCFLGQLIIKLLCMAKKILLVDDDMYIRDLYNEVLKEAGYDVVSRTNGDEALTELSKGGFDLILLDIMMPKLDGIGVLKSLKEKPAAAPNGPVILLTNLAHDPVLKEATSLGAQTFLIKADMTPDQLIEKVKGFLGE